MLILFRKRLFLQKGERIVKTRNVIIPERLLFELYCKLVLKHENVDDDYIISELTRKFESNMRRMEYGAAIERERRK